MYSLINRLTTKTNIIAGLVFIIIIILLVFPVLFGAYNIDIKSIFDVQFGFDTVFVQNLLDNLGEKGRYGYMVATLLVDTPYAIIYGFVYAALINKMLVGSKQKMRFLVYLPFAISFFDVLENTFTINFLIQYPQITTTFVPVAAMANRLKWTFATLTILVFFVLLIILMYKKRQKT